MNAQEEIGALKARIAVANSTATTYRQKADEDKSRADKMEAEVRRLREDYDRTNREEAILLAKYEHLKQELEIKYKSI